MLIKLGVLMYLYVRDKGRVLPIYNEKEKFFYHVGAKVIFHFNTDILGYEIL